MKTRKTRYVSLNEAADLLSVHRDTVERMAQRGLLTLYRIGGRTVRVAEADVLALARPINATGSEATK